MLIFRQPTSAVDKREIVVNTDLVKLSEIISMPKPVLLSDQSIDFSWFHEILMAFLAPFSVESQSHD